MEHFANEFDLVARLGVLSPMQYGSPSSPVRIDGPLFLQECAWGHLLNEHYLCAIDDYLYPGSRKYRRQSNPYRHQDAGERRPKLYKYFHGKQPDDG